MCDHFAVSWLLSLTLGHRSLCCFVSMIVTAFRSLCLLHALSPHSHSVKNVERTSSFHASSLSTRTRMPTNKTRATRNVSRHKYMCTHTHIGAHARTCILGWGERFRCVQVATGSLCVSSLFCILLLLALPPGYCLFPSLTFLLSLSSSLSLSLSHFAPSPL